ncbi:hypothetical protein GCM10009774_30790 [Cellulomonas gelida]|uniref:Uncharacterized protein n=1 Tax=Cellulomonas gelida TaxID=1712 RepID=A0A4Y3KNH6_9CELL|nr:hypothetical protein CGE01nite_17190 [Cellulomonas gelida]GGL38059.1 hypothetical protein GCM10009774_30790 [Cellulomonas gelida]
MRGHKGAAGDGLAAAHLYRFSDRPEYADDSGLLLRADCTACPTGWC